MSASFMTVAANVVLFKNIRPELQAVSEEGDSVAAQSGTNSPSAA